MKCLPIVLALVTLLIVTGCTVNSYPDGRRETVWGAPVDDGTPGYQPGTIQDETGERRRQTDLPE